MKDREIDELFFTRSLQKKASAPTLKVGFGIRNLRSAAQNHPQVMVKIPRRKGKSLWSCRYRNSSRLYQSQRFS